jgi:glycosyltransferase involved in cell wall biosynthesis
VALYAGTNNRAYFKAHGVPEKKLVFAPHAVDNERFCDDGSRNYEARAMQWRKDLSLKETDHVVLFAGKLEEKKDPALLIDAFDQLQSSNIHLIIAGNGPLEQALKNEASGNPNIQFVGFQNQSMMPVLYRLANCIILPSKGPGETWGLAVNEAMACGRPVIASNKCGSAIDLIHQGSNGYIFNAGDATDLYDKIKMFVTERNKENNMGASAFKSIQHWSIEEICKPVEKIIG